MTTPQTWRKKNGTEVSHLRHLKKKTKAKWYPNFHTGNNPSMEASQRGGGSFKAEVYYRNRTTRSTSPSGRKGKVNPKDKLSPEQANTDNDKAPSNRKTSRGTNPGKIEKPVAGGMVFSPGTHKFPISIAQGRQEEPGKKAPQIRGLSSKKKY